MAPRLRRDLVATIVDEQGVSCVEVTDPVSSISFRFYDFEYALAQQFTGQPREVVVSWASETYGVELSSETLDQFIEKLTGLGFLEGGSSGAQPAVLVPSSTSSGSQPFGELPTTVAVGLPPVAGEPPSPEDVFADALSDPGFVDAVAPEGLISGDATEYRLKEGGSGLWERGRVPASDLGQDREADQNQGEDRNGDQRHDQLHDQPHDQLHDQPHDQRHDQPHDQRHDQPHDQLHDQPRDHVHDQVHDLVHDRPHDRPHDQPHDQPKDQVEDRLQDRDHGEGHDGDRDQPKKREWRPGQVRDQDQRPNRDQPRGQDRGPSHREAPPIPRVPETVLPRLQILASPLPPVAGSGPLAPPVAPTPIAAPSPATVKEISPPAESPLASITQFINTEYSGPAPLGALDAAIISAPIDVALNSGDLEKPSDPEGASWTVGLAQQVDQPRSERRQPPRPEVVVMPPVAEVPISPPRPRRRFTALFVLLILAAAAAVAAWFLRPQTGLQAPILSSDAPTVHVVSPQPTTFYRWFNAVGVVVPARDDTLGFPTGGRVQDAMAPGTTFRAGETIARLAGVAERELAVNRIRSRVSFYEQLRDSSRAEGAENAAKQAEAKLTARKQELAAAQAALFALEIHPKAAGEIAELLVPKGAIVKAGAPVFRVRATGPRATFPLPPADMLQARALGFCRVETIPGSGGSADGGAAEGHSRAIDCSPSSATASGDQVRMTVDLVGATVATPGTQVRLASARYDGVFPVPRSAVVRLDGSNRLWVAASGGRVAESRTVEIAATVDDLSLVAHGISVGEAVIVDPPASLKNGTAVNVAR